MPLPGPFLRLHPNDDVVVARRPAAKGDQWWETDSGVVATQSIDMGHKMAIRTKLKGDPVRKYGQLIGYATEDIRPGDHVHVHNLEMGGHKLDYEFATELHPMSPPGPMRTFQGYRRPDGRAATRNYIGIVSTVNCSAASSRFISEAFDRELLAQFPNVDGVIALTHKGGCAMPFDCDNHRMLNRTLAGFAKHPNIAAYVIVGLGCETAQASFLTESENLVELTDWSKQGSAAVRMLTENGNARAPLMMNIQDVGGVRKTVERGIAAIRDILPEVNKVHREPIPISELVLGMNCGGSDGASGITANPALGVASDRLVAYGGTSALAETTEVYGGEHLLTRRAINAAVGQKLLEQIHWWEDYCQKFGTTIDGNPSVGNKRGGLTTIFEKSLGAIAKGGSAPLSAVYDYAEPMTRKGFVFMDTPGFDAASVTGLVAGGSNIVVFTTGRGSCFGLKPVPTIKVATNTPLFERMPEDMDINAGRILDGASLEEVGTEIFEKIISVASGEKTLSEKQGIGDDEFCPFLPGPML
jgi:altronate hydrolase